MHMLEETRVEAPTTDGLFLSAFKQMLEQERSGAKPAVAAGEPVAMGLPEPDKNPDKIMLKMYMESECPACRKFSTTIVKEVLAAEGLGDVIDFEYVAWGWGAIKTPPTERQLELDPHAGWARCATRHPLPGWRVRARGRTHALAYTYSDMLGHG